MATICNCLTFCSSSVILHLMDRCISAWCGHIWLHPALKFGMVKTKMSVALFIREQKSFLMKVCFFFHCVKIWGITKLLENILYNKKKAKCGAITATAVFQRSLKVQTVHNKALPAGEITHCTDLPFSGGANDKAVVPVLFPSIMQRCLSVFCLRLRRLSTQIVEGFSQSL